MARVPAARFEHCLGVAHLAYETALHFKLGQPELDISNEDLKVVELAGAPSSIPRIPNAMDALPGCITGSSWLPLLLLYRRT